MLSVSSLKESDGYDSRLVISMYCFVFQFSHVGGKEISVVNGIGSTGLCHVSVIVNCLWM